MTLVEALIAAFLTTLLGIPCYALLRTNLSALDIVASRSLQADQVREVFRLLGDGTTSFGTTKDTRGFTMVEGLHSRPALPSSWPLRSATVFGQFVMTDGALQVVGDTLSPVLILCRGARNPIPDCAATESRTVQGWLGSDPIVGQSTSNGIQFPATISVTITNPYRAARSIASSFGATQALGITETFRTQFYTMVEANP